LPNQVAPATMPTESEHATDREPRPATVDLPCPSARHLGALGRFHALMLERGSSEKVGKRRRVCGVPRETVSVVSEPSGRGVGGRSSSSALVSAQAVAAKTCNEVVSEPRSGEGGGPIRHTRCDRQQGVCRHATCFAMHPPCHQSPPSSTQSCWLTLGRPLSGARACCVRPRDRQHEPP